MATCGTGMLLSPAHSSAALDAGAVHLATVEVPAPWFHEVAIRASKHPQVDWGLHLDLTSEWPGLRWGPAASLESLRPGLNMILVHLAFDDDEMRGVAHEIPDWGSAWRQADYDFVTSSSCRELMARREVKLINWRDVARLWPHSRLP